MKTRNQGGTIMGSRIATYVLLSGLLFVLIALGGRLSELRIPGDQRDYEPAQPIAFSHRLHSGEMKIGCLYCHYGAEKSRHAGVPAASVCMNCHREMTASLGAIRAEEAAAKKEKRDPETVISPEIAKLYEALALGDDREPDPAKTPRPIAWVKVHNLPDFVYFDHRAHVNQGVICQRCHGPVESMERVRQFESLEMGWCVNCHRDVARTVAAGQPRPSTDCDTCHY